MLEPVIREVLQLKPQEKFVVIESLLESLDQPDKSINEIWATEAEKRLKAYREGEISTVPMEEIF